MRRRNSQATPRKRARQPAAQKAALSVVILAAGEGRRMQSALPKVLQGLAGRPLLKHVIDTARSLTPATLQVVYGHGGEQVRTALADEPVSWTLQPERLGTGHAAAQALQHIPDSHMVLMLYGDVPLISRATLAEMLALAGPRHLS
ncbi:MAG TPA: NTP transferase domain-containing protein, partial [Steroidobacteraceae bacterium]|nr:NTP transferase domain-containing protein [Steroidobacteraceae bacterium]